MKQQNSSVTVSPRESIGVQAAAHRLGISVGRVRTLLGQGRIEGAQKLGRRWQIPTRKGMPKIIPGHRGPQGSWYRKQRTQNGFIHANQHLLRLNRKDAGSRPAIALKLGKHSQYCHYVEVKGQSRLVYSPTKPSSKCGARLWLEVPPTVPVARSKFETPGRVGSGGAEEQRSGGAEELGKKRELIIFDKAQESPPQISFTPPGDRGQAVGVPEAAYLLRVSPQRVRQLLNQGRIAGASKISLRWRIPLGSSGLPQVMAGSRGPKGTWCCPPVQKTIIRINQAKIHSNTARNLCLPVIDIWHNGTVCHCHQVEIMGPSRILYRPHHGGAYSLWIEVATEVKLVVKGSAVTVLL